MRRRIKDTRATIARDVPAELLDPAAAVWHNRAAHLAYMAERRWTLDVRDRMGPGAPAQARRQAAAVGWAAETGITDVLDGDRADLHTLTAMGIYP